MAEDLDRKTTRLRRLMLAKQLYEHALDHSRTGAAADKMIAVHNFHNAIEIVLRAILLEHEIRVERELNIDFEQMLNNIVIGQGLIRAFFGHRKGGPSSFGVMARSLQIVQTRLSPHPARRGPAGRGAAPGSGPYPARWNSTARRMHRGRRGGGARALPTIREAMRGRRAGRIDPHPGPAIKSALSALRRRENAWRRPDRSRPIWWSPTACIARVYTDPAIFEREMERIYETVWIYCGHETQVPKAGDYYTVQIGRQPMIMVRGTDGKSARALQPLPAPRRHDLRRPQRQYRRASSAAPIMPGRSTPTASSKNIPMTKRLRGHAARRRTTPTAA